jgi:Heparinase II/III-like protein
MKATSMKRLAMATAITALYAGSAAAALPGTIRNEHPRLYASAVQMKQLARDAAVGPSEFPESKGKFSFKITSAPKEDTDPNDVPIFGGAYDPIFVRHVNYSNKPGQLFLQIYLNSRQINPSTRQAVPAAVATIEVQPGVEQRVVIDYDYNGKKLSVTVNENPLRVSWAADVPWSAKGQQFLFQANRNDRITDVQVHDGANNPLWTSESGIPIDVVLNRSWNAFLLRAQRIVPQMMSCNAPERPADYPTVCKTETEGRDMITEPAKWLSLAYRFTGKTEFLTAAQQHIVRIMNAGVQTGPDDGPEWSMAARIGAMGIYYDWLNDYLDDSVKAQLAAKIKETVTSDIDKSSLDVVNSICGNQPVQDDTFVCTNPVVFGQGDPRRSIAPYYVAGHAASAVTGAVVGLLAIADEGPQRNAVMPMIDTIYQHFAQGFLPARDQMSPDGGSATVYAYGAAGETLDRVIMLNRALDFGDDEKALELQLKLKSRRHLIYPYIYAPQGDGTYPARGDDFIFDLGAPSIGSLALAAAEEGDTNAAAFYIDRVLPARTDPAHPLSFEGPNAAATLMDRLIYPRPVVDKTTPMKLSKAFAQSGNVMMRDTWDFPNATLLEFKSASFITNNHHHMDQNSFSLNYKGPLLIDSGKYDKYGSNHWRNYYTRTIAHNSIVVFDPAERFAGAESNDGGQSMKSRTAAPTMEQLAPGGSNSLVGITNFDEQTTYSYVRANASKAYVDMQPSSNDKLDRDAGFIRSIVYLRTGARPTILTFDTVRPKKADLEISSLLHTAVKPASTVEPSGGTNGRYQFDFSKGLEPLTVRNGKGMVTIETILPKQAQVSLVGGNKAGAKCTQAADTIVKPATAEFVSDDCRFMVRELQGTSYVWRNYGILAKPEQVTRDAELGEWRIEITPRVAPAAGGTQHFLNVMQVADDAPRAVAAGKATLLSELKDVVAARLPDGKTVVFNGAVTPPATLSWLTGSAMTAPSDKPQGPTLVVGLKPETAYRLSSVSATGGVTTTLTETTSSENVTTNGGVLALDWN